MSEPTRLTICPACVQHIRHALIEVELTCPFCENRFALDELAGTTPTASAVPRGLKHGVMAASFVGATIFGAAACQGQPASDDEVTTITEADEATAVEPEDEESAEPPVEALDDDGESVDDEETGSAAAVVDSSDMIAESGDDSDESDDSEDSDDSDDSDSASDTASDDDETSPPSPPTNEHPPMQPEYGVVF